MDKVIGTSTPLEDAITLDAHLINAYRDCEQKFNFIDNLHVFAKLKGAAPAFGIAFHAAAEANRKAINKGMSHEDSLQVGLIIFEREYNKNMPPEMQSEVMDDDRRSLNNGKRIFTGFCEKYKGQGMIYKHLEVPFAMLLGEVKSPLSGKTKPVIYTGIIDAVIDMQTTYYVDDIKTTAMNITQAYLEGYRCSQALKGYVVVCRELMGVNCDSALVQAVWVQKEAKTSRAKPLNEYFHLFTCSWTTDQLDEWKHNTLLTAVKIEEARLKQVWQRDDGHACTLYGKCDYFDVCHSAPGIRDRIIEMDYEKAIWNPLGDERITRL